jgi:hypothetical protein
MALVAKYDHAGDAHVDSLARGKYYEQTASVGTDAAAIPLYALAYGVNLHPVGTTAVSYRTALPDYGPDYVGVQQAVSLELTGEILQGGIFQALVTAANMDSGTTATVNGTISGARQIETLTVVGTTDAAGSFDLYLTTALYGAGTANMTWTLNLGTALTPIPVATAIYAKIGGTISSAGTPLFYLENPGGTTAALKLTAYRAAANDPDLVFGYEDQLGMITGTSANTGSGAAVSTMTAATLIMGSAMRANATIGSFFSLTFVGTTTIKLTGSAAAEHDSTMRFTYNNSSTLGLTEGTSAVTTYGTATGDGYWFTASAAAVTSIEPPSRIVPDPLYFIGTVWAKATEAVLLEVTYWGHPKTGTAGCAALS